MTTAMTYDAANELTGIDTAVVSHDGAGNQTTTSTGDTYAYDEANRPVNITAGGTGPLTVTYTGNTAVGRSSLGSTTAVTSLLGVTSEQTPSSTIGYTRLPTGQVLSRREGTTRHYLIGDRLGSTQALIDQAGTITTRYAYTPYGQTSQTNLSGTIDQPYRYTGQHQDPTGLYKNGLRYYNPNQARWTQPDPALSLTNLPFANAYLYIGDNPLNYIDPTGAAGSGLEWAGIVGFGAASVLSGGYAALLIYGSLASYGVGYCTA